jgi:uncharacterized protein (DUF1778 family)
METKTPKRLINFRVTENQKKVLVNEAQREGRTLTNFVLWCIQKYIGRTFEGRAL